MITPVNDGDNGVKQEAAQNAASDKGQDQERLSHVTAALLPLRYKLQAYKRKRLSPEYRKEERERLTIIGIFLTAVFTFGTLIVFYFQLNEMRESGIQANKIVEANFNLARSAAKQADAADLQAQSLAENARVARESLIASQRAWIGPGNAKIEGAIEIGKAVDIFIEYTNTGREPGQSFTQNADTFFGTIVDEINGTSIRKINDYIAACKNTTALQGRVVFPSTGFSTYNITLKSRDLINQAVIDGSEILFVQGCFSYRTFSTLHHSYFCFFYNAKQTKAEHLNICVQGHYAD